MNAPKTLPDCFDAACHAQNTQAAKEIPDVTVDTTVEQFFDSPFTVEDIDDTKVEIQKHPSNSAAGIEEIHYKEIVKMDSVKLCHLINLCISTRACPTTWIVSILIGILKRYKPSDDPNSYRTICLESCMLEFVTLLIMRRVIKWADLRKLIPPSQNGFRKDYRTNNNAFILRCAIEKAKAMGKTLYVATVDITNAFPSTDHATLWLKLKMLGMSGKLFDWIRMIYALMQYKVRHENEFSDPFGADIGIMIGDTLSPEFWILYMADFEIPPTADQ